MSDETHLFLDLNCVIKNMAFKEHRIKKKKSTGCFSSSSLITILIKGGFYRLKMLKILLIAFDSTTSLAQLRIRCRSCVRWIINLEKWNESHLNEYNAPWLWYTVHYWKLTMIREKRIWRTHISLLVKQQVNIFCFWWTVVWRIERWRILQGKFANVFYWVVIK